MQVRAVRIGGAYSGSRDPRQHGARARGASECRRHVQLQRAPATCAPQWSSIVRIFNRREETQALERKNTGKKPLNEKIPVRCRRCRRCRRHPKLGNVPTQIVHRMHAAFDCCTQAQHMSKDTGLRGEPGHSHGINGSTNTGAHGHTDHTDEPHNHPNPPTHPHARRPKPRPPPQPRSQCKPPCWYRKFRCSESTRGTQRTRARWTHPSAALREVAGQ